MLDRLDFELHERTKLATEVQMLRKKKAGLQSIVRSKTEFLSNLPCQVKAMRKVRLCLRLTPSPFLIPTLIRVLLSVHPCECVCVRAYR